MVQGKIDAQSREKALQASAEEVAFDQLGIHQGSIAEAASEAIDLSTFKAKEDITTALSLLEKAQAAVDHLESGTEVYKTPPKRLQSLTLLLGPHQGNLPR